MKQQISILSLAALTGLLAAGSAHAALISHYTFDEVNNGTTTTTTPDSVGSNSATLGNQVLINTAVTGLGTGVLEMKNIIPSGKAGADGPENGATTSNSFSWANDVRTMTFWWKAKESNVNTDHGTFVSHGTLASGTRFDVKESGNTLLRVEVQGAGFDSNPTGFDNGQWQFVAVTVPDPATFADIAWFSGPRGGTLSGNLNTIGTSAQAIATGFSPLTFGDSIYVDTNPNNKLDRTPNGYLDDFQLYNEVLTFDQISSLFTKPGSVIGSNPTAAVPDGGTSILLLGMSLAGLRLIRSKRGA